jgi:hypothetical protein
MKDRWKTAEPASNSGRRGHVRSCKKLKDSTSSIVILFEEGSQRISLVLSTDQIHPNAS